MSVFTPLRLLLGLLKCAARVETWTPAAGLGRPHGTLLEQSSRLCLQHLILILGSGLKLLFALCLFLVSRPHSLHKLSYRVYGRRLLLSAPPYLAKCNWTQVVGWDGVSPFAKSNFSTHSILKLFSFSISEQDRHLKIHNALFHLDL